LVLGGWEGRGREREREKEREREICKYLFAIGTYASLSSQDMLQKM